LDVIFQNLKNFNGMDLKNPFFFRGGDFRDGLGHLEWMTSEEGFD
jgi:hypothetical protein